jgi:hypothetical protein
LEIATEIVKCDEAWNQKGEWAVSSEGTFLDFENALRGFESGVTPATLSSGYADTFVTPANLQAYNQGTLSLRDLQYTSTNSLGFVGYQVGEALLIDLGYYSATTYYGNGASTNTWTSTFLGKDGVTSLAALETPLQEGVILAEFGHNLQIIVNGLAAQGETLDQLIGTTKAYVQNGSDVSVTLTFTGILAAAHLVGPYGTLDLLLEGQVTTDENGTSVLQYIQQFGGYSTIDNASTDVAAATLINDYTRNTTEALADALWNAPADFYGNGSSDLLFQNTGGDYATWETNGASVVGGGNVGSPGAGWSEVGTGIFNTNDKSDVLFESSGGSYALWDMNGSSVVSVSTFGTPGAGWSYVGVGDFDGTGGGDILFENTAGTYAMWETNGTAVIGGGNVGSPGSGWTLEGVGYFGTGANSDILFENTAGTYAIWDMNGTAVSNVATLGSPGAGWTFKAIGNFDGTSSGDILFENTAGTYAMWETNGTAVVGGGNLGSPGTAWSFAGIGDYNADGKSDVLFQSSAGGSISYAAWEMNGSTVSNVVTFGSPGAGWTLQRTA